MSLVKGYIIGIDEVGRGSLAGPVTVTALAIPVDFDFRIWDFDLSVKSEEFNSKSKNVNSLTPQAQIVLRDSKKLSPRQREEWCGRIKECPEIIFAVKSVKPSVIDRINIAQAANLAAYRAVKALVVKESLLFSNPIYLDGGLYIKGKRFQKRNFENALTVVKADELVPAVSLASIVAKVHRDKLMRRLSKIYPNYGFDIHKGYGTKRHEEAIRRHGLSEFHRLTFTKKYNNIHS